MKPERGTTASYPVAREAQDSMTLSPAVGASGSPSREDSRGFDRLELCGQLVRPGDRTRPAAAGMQGEDAATDECFEQPGGSSVASPARDRCKEGSSTQTNVRFSSCSRNNEVPSALNAGDARVSIHAPPGSGVDQDNLDRRESSVPMRDELLTVPLQGLGELRGAPIEVADAALTPRMMVSAADGTPMNCPDGNQEGRRARGNDRARRDAIAAPGRSSVWDLNSDSDSDSDSGDEASASRCNGGYQANTRRTVAGFSQKRTTRYLRKESAPTKRHRNHVHDARTAPNGKAQVEARTPREVGARVGPTANAPERPRRCENERSIVAELATATEQRHPERTPLASCSREFTTRSLNRCQGRDVSALSGAASSPDGILYAEDGGARESMPPPPPNPERARARRRRSRVCLMHSARYQQLCSLVSRHDRRDDLLYALADACRLRDWLTVVPPARATDAHLRAFHDRGYVEVLREPPSDTDLLDEYGLVDDCEVMERMYDYCCAVAGASLHGAALLVRGEADVAINWGGGRHHAKKAEAAGFCYVNDVVLAVLGMAKRFDRILVLDIDIHHGDGLQEAFYTSDKVMTVSFHHFEKGFFPGSGHRSEVGAGRGHGFNLNVPLKQGARRLVLDGARIAGCGDETFTSVFTFTLAAVLDSFGPEAIVMVCGADTLSADPLGPFNLTTAGVRVCVDQVVSLDRPLLLLGGGGYCPMDTSRLWTMLTASAVGPGILLPAYVPDHAYFPLYGPDFRLETRSKTLRDDNDPEYLQGLREHMTKACHTVWLRSLGNG